MGICLKCRTCCPTCCGRKSSNRLWLLLYVVMFILPIVFMSLLWGGPGICPLYPLASQVGNINDKMGSKKPDGGADVLWGSGVCTIYAKPYDDEPDEVESNSNDFGIKVFLHEYIHCLQQALISGDAVIGRTYTPEVIVENHCNVPEVYVTKTKAAFAALPTEWRLLKKVVIFYAGCPSKSYSWFDLQDARFYGWGCPGMSSHKKPNNNLNVFEEGSAEYYSLNTLVPAAVSGWTTPFNGPGMWTARVAEAKTECGFPGNDLFRFKTGNGDYIEEELVPKLIREGYEACRNNYIGESVFLFLISTYRPATTSLELKKIWARVGEDGWAGAWKSVLGSSWSDFIEALEKDAYYAVDSNSKGSEGQELAEMYDVPIVFMFSLATIGCVVLVLFAVFLTYRHVQHWKKTRGVTPSGSYAKGSTKIKVSGEVAMTSQA